jgi:hypothetical protein
MALAEFYAWYAGAERMFTLVYRDQEFVPAGT